jgi:hypothetical protein
MFLWNDGHKNITLKQRSKPNIKQTSPSHGYYYNSITIKGSSSTRDRTITLCFISYLKQPSNRSWGSIANPLAGRGHCCDWNFSFWWVPSFKLSLQCCNPGMSVLMYHGEVQGSTVQIRVKTCHHTNKGVEAIFSGSAWNNVCLALTTRT